ncbi:hypothetical protein OIU84_013273 [Salix udensis]|uniref:Uncharacterized protein n=1 Tax=Salix udensis TaxID=889485 RepID=A0AAD6NUB2_9ROSI|nr:hypothetical protein OIU84_013273 [Salix udensis]
MTTSNGNGPIIHQFRESSELAWCFGIWIAHTASKLPYIHKHKMSVLTYTDLHSTVVDKNKNPSEVDAAVWAHASVKFPPRKPIFRSNVSMNREGSKLRTPVASRTAGQHPT